MRTGPPTTAIRSVIVVIAFASCLRAIPAVGQRIVAANNRTVVVDGIVEDLTPFRTFAVSSNGTLAIPQAQDYQLRFYTSRGVLVAKLGRMGEGPGELRNLSGSAPRLNGDQFWIIARSPSRVTFADERGAFAGGVPIPTSVSPPRSVASGESLSGPTVPVAVARDSSFVMMVIASKLPSWIARAARTPVFVHVGTTGAFKNFVAGVDANDGECSTIVANNSVPMPFCAQPTFQMRADASLMVAVHIDPIHGGKWSYHGAVVNVLTGDTTKVFQGSVSAVPIPARIADSTREAMASMKGVAPALADGMRHMQLPAYFPPVRGLLVGQDGAVWVEEATTQVSTRTWRWFDVRDRTIGAVSVPAQFTLVEILPGQLWGYEANADGIQSVIRYSIGLRH